MHLVLHKWCWCPKNLPPLDSLLSAGDAGGAEGEDGVGDATVRVPSWPVNSSRSSSPASSCLGSDDSAAYEGCAGALSWLRSQLVMQKCAIYMYNEHFVTIQDNILLHMFSEQ